MGVIVKAIQDARVGQDRKHVLWNGTSFLYNQNLKRE